MIPHIVGISRKWKCGDRIVEKHLTVEEAAELMHNMRPRKVSVTLSGNSLRFDVYLIDAEEDFDMLVFDIQSISFVGRNQVIEP